MTDMRFGLSSFHLDGIGGHSPAPAHSASQNSSLFTTRWLNPKAEDQVEVLAGITC